MRPENAREIEFKFAVPGEQSFRLLVQQLGLPASVLNQGVIQTNHFFDSQTLCLRNNGLAIRLREQGEQQLLTIKGEQQGEPGSHAVLTNRVEHEVSLTGETAQALLRGELAPAQAIERHFEHGASALLQRIRSACADAELVHIGKFRNRRIHLPPIGLSASQTQETLTFELDTSEFPDGSVDYEIEIEISEHSDAESIKAALIEMLDQAGIAWHSAPSKAVRFYAALRARSSRSSREITRA